MDSFATFSLAKPQMLMGISFAISLIYFIARSIYNIFFHPLAKYPGPILWKISALPLTYYSVKGTIPYRTHEIHEKYGPTVRLAPNELSYILEDAWADIYERKSGSRTSEMDRDENLVLDPPGARTEDLKLWSTDHAAHTRVRHVTSFEWSKILIADDINFRRNLNPGFSDKALKEQEPTLKKYVDLLMQRLHENCHQPLDMVKWFNLITFDVIGDLTFGESFGSLEHARTHPWVDLIVSSFKSVILIMSWKRYGLDKYIMKLASKKSLDDMDNHRAMGEEKLRKRLEYTRSHPDFLSSSQKNLGTPEGPTWPELVSLVGAFIPAGSETTATLLAGALYFLSTNPSTASKLVAEIRTAFKDESEINLINVSAKLPYMQAVINETLRIYPPAAGSLGRITPPEGCMIVGEFVPGNVSVAVNQWSANHSERNFRRPYEFLPGRWLGEKEFEGDRRKAFQPFSVGPRNCVGRALAFAESRLILARLIWNFDFELAEDARGWADKQPVYVVFHKPTLMAKLTPVVR